MIINSLLHWLRPIAFEYICSCIAREMSLMIVKIWLRCWTCRLTWNMRNILMRKYPEILFKQYFGSYSAAFDHPPPLLHRLLGQHGENMGGRVAAAGRGAERSHEHRVVSCVRLEREVLGVRWDCLNMIMNNTNCYVIENICIICEWSLHKYQD
jgi:hypothetical protein